MKYKITVEKLREPKVEEERSYESYDTIYCQIVENEGFRVENIIRAANEINYARNEDN